jgi:hypothetical protein
LGTTVRNQNFTQEEIMRLTFGDACHHSVKNLLSCHLRLYKTIILPVFLYECKTWSLTLREEHGLRVFENRVLRRIFGPKRDEVMVGWRKLHNKERHDLYSLPSIIRMIKSRRMRWVGDVAQWGRKRRTHIGVH